MPITNGVVNGSTNINEDNETQKKVDRRGMWQMDKCIVCHAKYFSDTAKQRHVETDAHKKRVIVHDFFLNEISSFQPSQVASSIIERISKCNESFIGVECLHEFIFSDDDKKPFWACSTCYCAGSNIDDVTSHLSSNPHRMNYIEDFHPDRKPKGKTAKDIAIELRQVTEAIISQRTAAATPEMIELSMSRQKAAMKLGLTISMPNGDQLVEPPASNSAMTTPDVVLKAQGDVSLVVTRLIDNVSEPNDQPLKVSAKEPPVKEDLKDQVKSSSKVDNPPKCDIVSSKQPELTKSADSSKTIPVNSVSKAVYSDIMGKLLTSKNEEIPVSERPTVLNANINATGGCLGANLIYEVNCADKAHLKSYLCSVCSIWETADRIIGHLLTDEHCLTFLKSFYKMHYKAVMKLSEAARSGALKQYAHQIEQIEGKPEVSRRLIFQPDSLTLSKVWPDYQAISERANRNGDPPPPGVEDDSLLPPPSRHLSGASSHRSSSSASQPSVNSGKEEIPKAVNGDRRSRGRRSRSKSRSESRSTHSSSSRSRRSPSHKRTRRNSPKSDRISDHRRHSHHRSSTDDRRQRRRFSRSRSRSPNRPRYREVQRSNQSHRSRSKSPVDPLADLRPCLSSTTIPTTMADSISWNERAAMFLEQIGDRRAASELLTSANDRAGPRQERKESVQSDPSTNELLSTLMNALCAQSSHTNIEELLSSLLKDKRMEASEQMLINLLLEERERQKRREDEQIQLIRALSATKAQPQQATVVDYGHRSAVVEFDQPMTHESGSMEASVSGGMESQSTVVDSHDYARKTESPEDELVREAKLNTIRGRAAAERAEAEREEAVRLARLVESGAVSWSGLQQLVERTKKPDSMRSSMGDSKDRRPPPSAPTSDSFSSNNYEREYNPSYPLPMPKQPQRNADSAAVYPVLGDVQQEKRWSRPPLPRLPSQQQLPISSRPPLPPPPSRFNIEPPSAAMWKVVRSAPIPPVVNLHRPPLPNLMSVGLTNTLSPMNQQTTSGAWSNHPMFEKTTFFPR